MERFCILLDVLDEHMYFSALIGQWPWCLYNVQYTNYTYKQIMRAIIWNMEIAKNSVDFKEIECFDHF